jgi:hypothetical protein
MEAMEPFAIAGISLNFSAEQGEGRVRALFGAEKQEAAGRPKG